MRLEKYVVKMTDGKEYRVSASSRFVAGKMALARARVYGTEAEVESVLTVRETNRGRLLFGQDSMKFRRLK